MGNPVTFVGYPRTGHEFDVARKFAGFLKSVDVYAHCDLVIDVPSRQVVRMDHKPVSKVGLEDVRAYYKSCMTRGATVQYNGEARADAIARVHDFLKANFHLS